MDDSQISGVNANLPMLLRHTKCSNELLSWLSDILSDYEIQSIKADRIDIDKAAQLYDFIKTKVGGYEALLHALNKTKQTKAVEILKRAVVISTGSNAMAMEPSCTCPNHLEYVVGSSQCTIAKITQEMLASSVNSVVENGWSSLALKLEVPYATIQNLRRLYTNRNLTLEELLYEVLTDWVTRASDKATLGVLLDAVKSCGWNAIRDELAVKFSK